MQVWQVRCITEDLGSVQHFNPRVFLYIFIFFFILFLLINNATIWEKKDDLYASWLIFWIYGSVFETVSFLEVSKKGKGVIFNLYFMGLIGSRVKTEKWDSKAVFTYTVSTSKCPESAYINLGLIIGKVIILIFN